VERWLGEFPFLIAVAAGALAYTCGLLLRRGLALAGGTHPPAWPADGLRALGVLSWLAAFLWAWSLGPRPGRFGVITTLGTLSPSALTPRELTAADLALTIACWLLVIAGALLAAWSLAARIRNGLFGKSPDRLAERPPYSLLRRPMSLGVGVVLLGATQLAGTLPAWACLLAVALAALLLQEFDELELRARVPWLAEQHRRIPRFLPRRIRQRG
jgi:protein-S-isoprenylcysteine O-methyltransferase Ste14